jgi:hypothetical protein
MTKAEKKLKELLSLTLSVYVSASNVPLAIQDKKSIGILLSSR